VEAVKQESLHADLLPYEEALFNALKELVAEQQLKLKEYLQYEEEDENKPQAKNFRYIIYNTEIERVQFLMKMYLRIRLKKVTTAQRRSNSTASTS
jgi:DNA replication initiation complex subunit (GINS family)